MIKVFVWNYRGSNIAWGHASMSVGTAYISWWPQGADRDYKKGDKKSSLKPIYSVPHIHDRTFDDDVADENQPPDHTIEIKGLDEPRIQTWWRTYNVPGREWTTLGRNCSTTVGRGLMVGGGDDYAEGARGWLASWNTVWTPNNVANYANAIRRGLASAGGRAFAINFIRRFRNSALGFTSLTVSMDEVGLGKALYREIGSNTNRLREVFTELNTRHNSDADDVAEVFVNQIRTGGGANAQALARDKPLKDLLVKILKEGWPSAGEQACIDYIQAQK